jgi:hypothetical protein
MEKNIVKKAGVFGGIKAQLNNIAKIQPKVSETIKKTIEPSTKRNISLVLRDLIYVQESKTYP